MGKLFVTVFAFAPAPKTNIVRFLHPDMRICPQLKSSTVIDFWLRTNCTATLRQCPFCKICYILTDSAPTYQLCTATRISSIKLCTWMAKTTPYPPCTVTALWLKYQDPARCCRRVTRPRGRLSPSLKQPTGLFLYARSYCRAVSIHAKSRISRQITYN